MDKGNSLTQIKVRQVEDGLHDMVLGLPGGCSLRIPFHDSETSLACAELTSKTIAPKLEEVVYMALACGQILGATEACFHNEDGTVDRLTIPTIPSENNID